LALTRGVTLVLYPMCTARREVCQATLVFQEIGQRLIDIKIITLIATLPRTRSLIHKSLPSFNRQTQPPAGFVIVSDRRPLTDKEKAVIAQGLPSMQPHFLFNDRTPGVAGTWNAGLAFIAQHWPHCYVAVLDDDDEWSPDHIEACFEAARQTGWPDVVVSGLRLCKDGVEIPRTPPADLSINDFLAGNPGWQGSNTFVSIAAMLEVGGFTEGLASTNDRDLAIRLLSRPRTRIAYTGSGMGCRNHHCHRAA